MMLPNIQQRVTRRGQVKTLKCLGSNWLTFEVEHPRKSNLQIWSSSEKSGLEKELGSYQEVGKK